MRVVDSHVHLYPPEANRSPGTWAAEHGEPQWANLCTRLRKNGRPVQSFPEVEELLRAMDAAGVERSVLLGWYWQNAATCSVQNRFYADSVRQWPDRLTAFASVQPGDRSRDACEEMRRSREQGLVGLGELSPHSQGYDIDNARFAAVLALAAEWGWPINLHVTDPNSRDYPGRVETPLDDFIKLARGFPHCTFILAHWGGLLPLRNADAAALPNLYYDTAASPLLYDDSVWRRFLAVVAADHVLFGSDFPLNNYPKLDPSPAMERLIDEARGAGVDAVVLRDAAVRLLKG